VNEGIENPLATSGLGAEQSSGLRQRQLQPWHFAEFHSNARAEIVFVATQCVRICGHNVPK
jgi:hypothetical protein